VLIPQKQSKKAKAVKKPVKTISDKAWTLVREKLNRED